LITVHTSVILNNNQHPGSWTFQDLGLSLRCLYVFLFSPVVLTLRSVHPRNLHKCNVLQWILHKYLGFHNLSWWGKFFYAPFSTNRLSCVAGVSVSVRDNRRCKQTHRGEKFINVLLARLQLLLYNLLQLLFTVVILLKVFYDSMRFYENALICRWPQEMSQVHPLTKK
jgi:hypothetical protein